MPFDTAAIAAGGEARRARLCSTAAPGAARATVHIVSDTIWPHGWVGKNNLMLALEDLAGEGLAFDFDFRRVPFFLRGSQRNIDAWYDEIGVPRGSSRAVVNKKLGRSLPTPGGMFDEAGIPIEHMEAARERSYLSDTMDSHRLAWHASTLTPPRSEGVWEALSRKWFEGRTDLPRIDLADRGLLMEAARDAGMDAAEAQRVLDDPSMYRREIEAAVKHIRREGVSSIPVFIFDFDGAGGRRQQLVHHGSDGRGRFAALLRELHRAAGAAAP